MNTGFALMIQEDSRSAAFRYYEHRVFAHHLYEYEKGLRNLVLLTASTSNKDAVKQRLQARNTDYYIQEVNGTKINVFFGDSMCVDIVRRMNFKSLSDLTAEEDFILGVMLGYARLKQCERYLKKKHGCLNAGPTNNGECQS